MRILSIVTFALITSCSHGKIETKLKNSPESTGQHWAYTKADKKMFKSLKERANKRFKSADTDGNKSISREEWVQRILSAKEKPSAGLLLHQLDSFDRWDQNSDKALTQSELFGP